MAIQLSYFPFDDVGAVSDVAKISVDDSSAISHTITAGKKGIVFQNTGNSLCWIGGSTVDPANERGIILLPRAMMMFRNAKSTFAIYFKCASGGSTTIGILEYD